MCMVHPFSSSQWGPMHVRSRPCLSSLYRFTDVLSVQHVDLPCSPESFGPSNLQTKANVCPHVARSHLGGLSSQTLTMFASQEFPQASILGFFVPYFERAVTRLPTPPYKSTVSTCQTTGDAPTQVYSPNQKPL